MATKCNVICSRIHNDVISFCSIGLISAETEIYYSRLITLFSEHEDFQNIIANKTKKFKMTSTWFLESKVVEVVPI